MQVHFRLLIFWLYLSFHYGIVIGQNSYGEKITIITKSGNPELSQIESLKNLIQSDTPIDTLGLIHYYISFRYYRITQFHNSKNHALLAKQYFEEEAFQGYQLPNVIGKIGDNYLNMGMFTEALSYYEILDTFPLAGRREMSSLANAKLAASKIYRSKNDFQTALLLLESTQNYVDSITLSKQAMIYLEYSIIYSNLNGQNSLRNAYNAVQKSIDIDYDPKTKSYVNPRRRANQLQQLAFIALKENDIDKANSLYKEVVNFLSESDDITSQVIRHRAIFNVAETFMEQGMNTEAKKWAQMALDNSHKITTTDHLLDIEATYSLLSRLYLDENKMDSSYHYAQLSLEILSPSDSDNSICQLCIIDALTSQIKILAEKYNEKKDQTNRQLIIAKTKDFEKAADKFIQESLLSEAAVDIKSILFTRLSSVIDILYEIEENSLLWILIEKSKGLLLFENIVYKDQDYEVDKEKLRQLKNVELLLDFKLTENKESSEIKAALHSNRIKQIKLKQSLQDKISISVLDVTNYEQIQKIIPNETIIQYHVGSHFMYGITVEDSSIKAIRLGKTDSIIIKVNEFLTELYKRSNHSIELQNLHDRSYALYELLISTLHITQSDIIIIPDNVLHFLPFEILLMQKYSSISELVYLINSVNIKYQLSGSLLYNSNYRPTQVEYISFIQPNYYSNTEFPSLEFSDKEKESLDEIINLKTSSSKIDFLSEMSESKLIHFSGHALLDTIDNNNSYLAFGGQNKLDRRLSLKEIYNQKSEANLIVLSACETGKGNVLTGEGISNLTRGFTYAGIDAVISSLWAVNEQSTALILQNFYKELHKGKRKSVALRNAKLEYLETAPDHLKHPYYWSSLIMSGDDTALSFKSNRRQLYLGIMTLCISLLIIIKIKIRN